MFNSGISKLASVFLFKVCNRRQINACLDIWTGLSEILRQRLQTQIPFADLFNLEHLDWTVFSFNQSEHLRHCVEIHSFSGKLFEDIMKKPGS